MPFVFYYSFKAVILMYYRFIIKSSSMTLQPKTMDHFFQTWICWGSQSLKHTLSYVYFRWMYYAHSYPCRYPMLKWFNSISLYYSRNLSLMMIFVNHEVGLDRWTVCMFPTKQSHHEMAALRQGRKGIGAVGNEFMKILNMNKKNTILNTNKSN